ncbi:hypothetical protein AK830_g11522 [Neonectria ditissima]|uniref:Alpha/beta hydrolase fold-3 domain-containing protein n=1 Tax=Neonectria ditissima TaxID=78410 RepID=A0A0N8H532_9HYPO|nr:hypothetical protein AK830_g11522 [Neonectria ditissima]
MVVAKDKPEYVDIDNFKPLPKYGHLSELDPEFAKVKAATDQMVEQIWEPSLSLDDFRKMWLNDSLPPAGCPKEGVDVTTETRRIPMRDGAEVEIKVYTAREKKPGSALVMRFHGGGWVVGGHCTEHSENLLIAGRTNSVVVSVDYRMAPEYRFPYSANDCLDSLKWSKENASSLGVDAEKIILAGGSAGGNLVSPPPIITPDHSPATNIQSQAAVAALMARDEDISGIVAQVLCFPVTCHPKFAPADKYELGSFRQNHDASIVTSARLEWFLDHYIPEPTPDWRLSCLLAPSLRGLPPAWFVS